MIVDFRGAKADNATVIASAVPNWTEPCAKPPQARHLDVQFCYDVTIQVVRAGARGIVDDTAHEVLA